MERALPGTHPPTHKPRSGGTASSSVWPWQCQQVACAAGAHLRHVCHAGIFRWKSEPHLCQSVAVRSASGLPKYSASVSASVSVSTTSSHSRGRGVGHTTRLREPPMADDAGDDLPPQAPGNGAGGAQAAPAMAAVVADEALNGFSFSQPRPAGPLAKLPRCAMFRHAQKGCTLDCCKLNEQFGGADNRLFTPTDDPAKNRELTGVRENQVLQSPWKGSTSF